MTSLDSQVFASQILGANHTTTVRDGWAVVEAPGHTPETYDCRTVRSGRETAVAYVLRRLAGSGNDEADAESLDRLLSLVDRDPDSRTHGCMRWYAEETRVSDTNAAFFSVVPLAALIHMRPDLVPPEHQQRLRELFAETSAWFAAECRQPRLYYPNKIISDGAVLLAVGVSLGDDELIQSALAFLRSWCEYTSDRGWGWGEILSLGYQRVILMALRLAILLTQPRDPELAEALRSHERDVLEEAAFHDGAEFVPTIRSYNFSGRPRKRAFAYSLLGLPDNSFDELILQPGDAWTKTLALLLFPHELTGGVHALPTVPRKRTRRVFESATATTWIGDGVRLGSVSRFPVMPDHYQQTGWGLGWQSFPVSAMIDELGVSALYWYARKDEAETTHPYYGEDGLKRNYVLAGKPPYPGFTTHATQRDGTALVVRTISRIHDDAIDLADQWVFRRGVNEVTRSGEWFIQQYGACALAVRPLARYATGAPELQPPEPETHVSGDDFLVRVPLHRAADGALVADRLESAWIIVVRDHVSDLDAFKEELRSVHVNDQARYVFDVPRMDYAYIRSVSLNGSSPSDEPLSLSVDYHSDLWR